MTVLLYNGTACALSPLAQMDTNQISGQQSYHRLSLTFLLFFHRDTLYNGNAVFCTAVINTFMCTNGNVGMKEQGEPETIRRDV